MYLVQFCVLAEKCQVAVCLEENKCRCSLNWDSKFSWWWNFWTQIEFGQVTRHPKKWRKDPKFVVGDFQKAIDFHKFDSLPYTIFIDFLHHPNPQIGVWKTWITIHRSTRERKGNGIPFFREIWWNTMIWADYCCIMFIVAKKTLQNRFQIDWSYIWSIEVVDTICYYEMIDID